MLVARPRREAISRLVSEQHLFKRRTCRLVPPCLIGIAACSSAHHWARKLHALGRTVRLIARQIVKLYVKSNKNVVAYSEVICEAVDRPTMRFVPIKNAEQQSVLSLHRVRHAFIKARTAQAHQIRSLLAEDGLIVPKGIGLIDMRVPDMRLRCEQRVAKAVLATHRSPAVSPEPTARRVRARDR